MTKNKGQALTQSERAHRWYARHRQKYGSARKDGRWPFRTFGNLRVLGSMQRFEGTCQGPCHRRHRDDLIQIDGKKICADCRFYSLGDVDEEMQRRANCVRTKVRPSF